MQTDIDSCLSLMRACAVAIFSERHTRPIAPRVRAHILATLVENHSKLDSMKIASALAMSIPTLRRKLNREGTSYQRIVDDVRFELAKELLVSGMIIEQIAENLDFTSAAVFSRAFKEWSGNCPIRWVMGQRG